MFHDQVMVFNLSRLQLTEIKTLILQKKLKVNIELLYLAVVNLDYEIIKFLIEYGIEYTPEEEQIIYKACWKLLFQYGHDSIVQQLISHIAAPPKKFIQVIQELLTCLFLYEAVCRQDYQIVRYLLDKGAKIDTETLHKAVSLGNLEIIKYLLDKKGNINSIDTSGNTLLFKAINMSRIDIITLLLRYNPDIKLNALYKAIEKNYVDIITRLLNVGININMADKNKVTPLHYAIQFQHTRIVNRFLNYGANVNAQDSEGNTPLHIAARNQDTISSRLLMQFKANLSIENNKGQTPTTFLPSLASLKPFNQPKSPLRVIHTSPSNDSFFQPHKMRRTQYKPKLSFNQ